MTANIVNALNSHPSGKFQIDSSVATYDFINAACFAFVPIWSQMSADMSQGTGPPPAGTYLHFHAFTGPGKATNLVTYDTNTFNLTIAGGKFKVPPDPPAQTALKFLVECWAKTLFDFLYSPATFMTLTVDGGVLHTHDTPPIPTPFTTNWLPLSTPVAFNGTVTLLSNNWGTCMLSKFSPGSFKLTEPLAGNKDFFEEFTKAFLTEIRDNSQLLPAVGQGHIHLLL